MRRRYELPQRVEWRGDTPDDGARLERTILQAVRRAVAMANHDDDDDGPSFAGGDVSEPFNASRLRVERSTYLLPSYDDQGAPHPVPVDPRVPESEADITALIAERFGRSEAQGNTQYGVQLGSTLYWVEGTTGRLRSTQIVQMKQDERKHWVSLGTASTYGTGRYIYRVNTAATEANAGLGSNVGSISELGGGKVGGDVYSNRPIGFTVVFDVPFAPAPSGRNARGGGGGGILPGKGGLIPLRGCHPIWDTSQLTDSYYAGMSDGDLERLFINLCVARAVHNLDLCREYILHQLTPRFTGPNGATNTLSEYSRHELQHFEENLALLRGLVIAADKLAIQIHALEAELDTIVMATHETDTLTYAPLGFGAGHRVRAYWPTYHDPSPRDAKRAAELMDQLKGLGEKFRIALTGITKLVEDDPVLTQFISGLDMSQGIPITQARTPVTSLLPEGINAKKAQAQVLAQFDDMLTAIEKSRRKLCLEPERVLDVPTVYTQVQELVKGVNPRFDTVVAELIAHHRRVETWIDVGLGVLGLALFLGGLFLSLFGGPAGVAGYLAFAGTVLSGVMALRSIDKAMFKTVISEASVTRGAGFIGLEAAEDARFWATVDTVFFAVDVGLSGLKGASAIVKARRAESLLQVTKAIEKAENIPFEEIFKLAAGSKIELTTAEVAALTSKNTKLIGETGEAIARRIAAQSGEVVFLGTKVGANNGIDLLMVRRKLFEQVFGQLADPSKAAEILAKASPEQQKQLARLLTASNAAEDLISLEVKASRSGTVAEELLKPARGGIAYDQIWFKGILEAMSKSKDSSVVAAGKLLEEVIGQGAKNMGRITRIAVTITPQGVFKLTRLNEDLIHLAQDSLKLYRGRTYSRYIVQLIEAQRIGDAARVSELQGLLKAMNDKIHLLDSAVNAMKNADAASGALRAQQALDRAAEAVRLTADLEALGRTPAVLDSLFVANATLSLNLQVARREMDDLSTSDAQLEESLKSTRALHSDFESFITAAMDRWEKEQPGIRARLEKLAEDDYQARRSAGTAE
jgi:hypothetical protein